MNAVQSSRCEKERSPCPSHFRCRLFRWACRRSLLSLPHVPGAGPVTDREGANSSPSSCPSSSNLLTELHKVIIGQERGDRTAPVGDSSRAATAFSSASRGLAKPLMISTLAKVPAAELQSHPVHADLMPADITGTDILEEDPITGKRQFPFPARASLRQHRAGR